MGVLDSILAYKAQKDAQARADIDAIPQGIAAFTAAKQVAQKSELDRLGLNVSAASHGLRIGPNGSITRDTSLMSPLEQLLEKGKVAEAAKNMGDRNLFNQVTGLGGVTQVPTQSNTPVNSTLDTSSADINGINAPEIDPFTGKQTTLGAQQEAQNKLIEAKGLEKVKTESKNEEKLKGMEAIEGDLDSLLSLYNKIPAHDRGPIEGRTRGVYAKAFGTDTSLTTFEDSGGLVLANISREFGGEKGVLTDADIRRIKAAFPNKTDTDDIAKAKIDFIKDFVRRKIEVKEKSVSGKKSVKNTDSDILGKLGLDPTKYELVRE